MREIKFRAWDYSNEEMLSVIGIRQWGTTEVEVENKERDTYVIEDEEEFEIMQYTGLKDKSGVEIFDGDIVQFTYNNRKRIEQVRFIDGSFALGCCITLRRSQTDEHKETRDSIEVIGSIHQNPNLLAEGGE